MEGLLDAFAAETEDFGTRGTGKVVVVRRVFFAEFDATLETVPGAVDDADTFKQRDGAIDRHLVHIPELMYQLDGAERFLGA